MTPQGEAVGATAQGDADIASVAALAADPSRAKILLALGDMRALPASVLADEAGVSASTASEHLARLVNGGLLKVERHGRHRYFRVASAQVAELIEALARLASPAPVKSLRQGTRAAAVRSARTCYDHLAGRLGTGMMEAMLERGLLAGGDGLLAEGDRLSAPGSEVDYRLTPEGVRWLSDLGIDVSSLPRRRPLIRYCVDWSEQRHHLAGSLGAALCSRLLELTWIKRAPRGRAVFVTPEGAKGLQKSLGFDFSPS
jgi:DNA-binding transcriptional ArsR family regulator